MADETKTYLIDFKDNLAEYAARAADAKTVVDKLKMANEELKSSGTATATQIEQSNAALRTAQAEYKNATKNVDLATKAQNANGESYERLLRGWQLAQTELKLMKNAYTVNSDGVRTLSAEYVKQSKVVADAKKNLDNFGKGVHDNRLSVAQYSESIEESMSKFGLFPAPLKAAVNGIKAMTTASWAFIATPLGAVIAAIALAVGALTSYFKRSEEGQNALTKMTMVFKVVMNNVLDIVDKVGKWLVQAFTEPKKAIQQIGDFIKSQITNRLEALAGMGKALIKIFSGDFKQGFKELGNNFVDFNTGVKNTIDKIKGAITAVIDENKREMEIARQIADQKAALIKRERAEIVNDAKLERDIAELRAKTAQKDKYSGEQRLAMIDKLVAMENELMTDDLDIAQQKAKIHAAEMAMSSATIEMLDEQARLEADIFKIQQTNADKRRSFERMRQSAVKDMLDDLRKQAEAAVNTMEFELNAFKLNNESKLKDATENNQMLTRDAVDAEQQRLEQINAKEREFMLAQLAFKINEIDAKENESEAAKNAEKLKLQQEFDIASLAANVELQNTIHDMDVEFEETERQRKIDALATDYENELAALNGHTLEKFAVLRDQMQLQHDEELRNAERTGADVNAINAKYARAELEMKRTERDAKLELASGLATAVSNILGKSSAAGKAASVAMTMIETFRGAQAAFTGMVEAIPGPIGIAAGVVAAAGAVAVGISNVKKILAVKTPNGGGGGGASMDAGGSSMAAAATRVTAKPLGATTLTPVQSAGDIAQRDQTQTNTVDAMVVAVSKIKPVVTVEDINARANDKNQVEVRANV